MQRKYGMPIDPAPYSRPSSSEPACRAVVAARLNAPAAAEALLRALRVRRMAGGLIDEGNYNNDTVNKLTTQGFTQSGQARADVAAQIQKIMMDELPAIPLAIWAASKKRGSALRSRPIVLVGRPEAA